MNRNKKGQLTLGKWHFKLGWIPYFAMLDGQIIHFGIFRLNSYPSEGMMFTKENYTGFWFRKTFSFKGFEISL